MGGAGVLFSGAGVLFFFKNFKKKKKIFFFQNRFKKVITFPKRHADNFLEISPILKTSYAFWSWICLWRFFDKIRKFPSRKKNFGRRPKFRPKAEIPAEGRDPCSSSYKNPYCLEVLAVGSSIPPDGIDFFFSKKKL